MTTSGLVSEELQPTPTPSPPRPVVGVALAGLGLAVAGVVLMVLAPKQLRDYNHHGIISTLVGAVLVFCSLYPLWPSFRSFAGDRRRARLLREDELVEARRASATGREEAQIAVGYAAGAIIVASVLLVAFANHGGIAQTFFTASAWQKAFPQMIRAFWTNIWVAIVSEILV